MTPAEKDEATLAAARALTRAALDLIYADPHQWSSRPCPTCRTVTALVGAPFGCNRFQVEGRKR